MTINQGVGDIRFTNIFNFFLFISFFQLLYFITFFYTFSPTTFTHTHTHTHTHDPHPRPTTHDPRPLPPTHDPRHLATLLFTFLFSFSPETPHTQATIGDKIVETLYLNRVTSENKRIRTLPCPLHSKLGCLLFSIGS